MLILGSLIIVISISAAYILTSKMIGKPNVIIFITLIAVFAGGFCILSERITKLTVSGVGTITTAADSAKVKAAEIDKIWNRVNNQSATIDIVSRTATEAENKLEILDSTITIANNQIDAINEISNFILVVTSAQNDDRFCFDSLKVWGLDEKYIFHKLAFNAFVDIVNKHGSDSYLSNMMYIEDEIDSLNGLNFPQLIDIYDQSISFIKHALIEYTWQRKDLKKIDKLDFFINVIQHDSSLMAVSCAGRYFAHETNLKKKPLAIEYFINWWKDNREKYLTSK